MRQRSIHPASFMTGVRLKELREEMNLSVRQLSNLSGVDFTMIKKIEIGKTDPSVALMSRIMVALELDLRDFFNERYIELFRTCLKEQGGIRMNYNNQFEEEAMLVVLGDRLKMIRASKGYTIKELAKLADIERNGYAKIERGDRKVSIGLLCKITIALGISPADLFDDEFYKVYNKYMIENDPKNINQEIDFSVLVLRQEKVPVKLKYFI